MTVFVEMLVVLFVFNTKRHIGGVEHAVVVILDGRRGSFVRQFAGFGGFALDAFRAAAATATTAAAAFALARLSASFGCCFFFLTEFGLSGSIERSLDRVGHRLTLEIRVLGHAFDFRLFAGGAFLAIAARSTTTSTATPTSRAVSFPPTFTFVGRLIIGVVFATLFHYFHVDQFGFDIFVGGVTLDYVPLIERLHFLERSRLPHQPIQVANRLYLAQELRLGNWWNLVHGRRRWLGRRNRGLSNGFRLGFGWNFQTKRTGQLIPIRGLLGWPRGLGLACHGSRRRCRRWRDWGGSFRGRLSTDLLGQMIPMVRTSHILNRRQLVGCNLAGKQPRTPEGFQLSNI